MGLAKNFTGARNEYYATHGNSATVAAARWRSARQVRDRVLRANGMLMFSPPPAI